MKLYGRVNGVETEIAGGGGGGGSLVETVLYDNVNLATVGAVNVTQDLLQPYTNFDQLRIEYAYLYGGAEGDNRIYPFIKTYTVEELETMRTSQYNGRKGYILFIVLQGMYLALDIVNVSQFKISELSSQSQFQHYITKITGIKY